jgi:DNA-binding NtrC family response regulator
MAEILIVDDEPELGRLLGLLFREQGHCPRYVSSGEAALKAAAEQNPDLILLDLHLNGMNGMETLRRLKSKAPGAPIVIMTACGDVSVAVDAMKSGAVDFITKPFNNLAFLSTVNTHLAAGSAAGKVSPKLVGESPAFRKALELAFKFAAPDINVLLLGETGTGKELFAHTIHTMSKRSNGPFVALDCSMLSEHLVESELFGHVKGSFTGADSPHIGRLELAQGGTLFLDEIGNLPPSLQTKLLRVIQERCMMPVGGRRTIRLDVRVISATNADLTSAVRTGDFRKDLFYRLQEVAIQLPSLRERSEDIHLLAELFVSLYAKQFGKPVRGISSEAQEVLDHYAWPGNIRELESAIKSAVVLAEKQVLPENLPLDVRAPTAVALNVQTISSENERRAGMCLDIELELGAAKVDLKAITAKAAEQAECLVLTELLNRGCTKGARLAKMVGVDPKTLRTKLRKYGLEPHDAQRLQKEM